MPTMFPPSSEYSLDQLQLLKPSKASESTENLDINNSMGNALLDMFNFNASCGSSNTGCSASLEKLSFADVMQFADYGPKLSLNQTMDDQNEQIERDPEHAFDPVFFLKFPVLASDQKAMDHKLLDHHIHDQMALGTDSEGNYHTNGSDEHGAQDLPTSENTSNLKQELNLSTNSNNTIEKLGQNTDHQQMMVPLDGPKLVGFSSTSYRPEPPQSKPKRKRSRVCKNSEEVESQRMTHIAVERNRRKQMNEHLRVLRSLMPGSYVQRGDQASIIGGAIEFVRELEQLLQCLESQKRRRLYAEASNSLGACRPPQTDALAGCLPIQSSFPVFPIQPDIVYEPLREDLADNKSPVADIEVKLVGCDAMIKILSQRRPGQLLKTITALENLQFSILHTNITTIEQTVLYSFNVKVGEDCRLSAEDIANSVQQIFNMIHATCIGYIKD
ncbi:transcription factor FAMA isoform X2 [Cryptomeria japonica]|nr:transcription factor FAMA isoform X2 [Cryptomeria japonica]